MSVNEDDIDDDREGAFDEYVGEECPVCGNSDCETHMVVIFVDGYPHDDFGALTHNDWNEIAQRTFHTLLWFEPLRLVDRYPR